MDPVAGPVSLELVGQLGGRIGPVAKARANLYVGVGQRIAVVDVSDPRSPRVVRLTAVLPASVEALAATDTLLVAATGGEGVSVFDLDRPRRPRLRSSVALPGFASGVAVSGSRAYVADGPAGLRIVDLSRPSSPKKLGVAFDLHHVRDVAVTGKHAFLAAADEGLLVANVARPRSPRGIGKLFTGGFGFGVMVRSDIAYLADGWGGLRIIDVSTPRKPRRLATVTTAGWATDLAIRKTKAYLAGGLDGLRVVDIEKPRRPRKLGILRTPTGWSRHVEVRGGFAYVSDILHGLRAVNVSKPRRPRQTDVLAPFGSAQTLAVANGHAYVAARRLGLRVIDVSNPASPRQTATFVAGEDVTTVNRTEDNLFVVGPSGLPPGPALRGASLSDGSKLELQGPVALTGHTGQRTFPTPEGEVPEFIGLAPNNPYVHGSTLYYPGEWGLLVVDGSTPSPCELGFLQTWDGSADGTLSGAVTVQDGLAYVSMSSAELFVVDVSDPKAMALLERVPVPKGAGPLAVGSRLYAITEGQILTYDLTDPLHPVPMGSVDLPAPPGSFVAAPLTYTAGRLFVAAGGAGLVVVDVSDLANPRIAGRVRLPGKAGAVVVEGEYAYVATQTGGLSIVRWGTAADPATNQPQTASPLRLSPAAVQTPCEVKTTDDAGPDSLRSCIGIAGAQVSFDPVVFPPGNPATIHVESPLFVNDDVAIDATEAGVILDSGGESEHRLEVPNRNVVRGLHIRGFGIAVRGNDNLIEGNVIEDQGIGVDGDRNRIRGNRVGTNPEGTVATGFGTIGIFGDADDSVVGGPDESDRNVISGAVDIFGPRTVFQGNHVRTDITGTVMFDGPPSAISLDHNGRQARIVDNVVGGDIGAALLSGIAITGNHVGFDASGTTPFECTCGISIFGPFNRVGGSRPHEGNLVRAGIRLFGENIALGNVVGADAELEWGGLAGGEISLQDSGINSVVGGRSPHAGNVVAAPFGISLEGGARSNLILGNRVGTDGAARTYDMEQGISLSGAGGNFVVLNQVAGVGASGIHLRAGSDENTIRANVVHTCGTGLDVGDGRQNLFSFNTVFANGTNGHDAGVGNRWDDGRRGNRWDDYMGMDANSDGIGDVPYPVDPNGEDRFPLMSPP